MHFVGMFGFHLPIRVSYDINITLLSLALAVLGCGAALWIVATGPMQPARLIGAGTLTGVAIVSMHYTGMAALKLIPPITYTTWLVIVSILVAIAASILAWWSAYRLRSDDLLSTFWRRAGSAVIQGSAIYGVYYIGMAAAHFAPDARSAVPYRHDLDPTTFALVLGGAALLFLLATLLISSDDERRAGQLELRIETAGAAYGHASEEIRDLSSRLVEVYDAETRRVASELHDIVGQNLSALTTELAAIQRLLPRDLPEEALSKFDKILQLAKSSAGSVRKVMAELRPPGIDQLGLGAALRWHVREFESRTGIRASISADESIPKASPPVEDAVLRIFLEALTNVAKHAGAKSVNVKLARAGAGVSLTVADDGRGFDPQLIVPGRTERWGLGIMWARAAAVAGKLHIYSKHGEGTLVEFAIPEDRWA